MTSLGEQNGLPLSMGAVIKLVRTQLLIEFMGLTKTGVTGLSYIDGERLASALAAGTSVATPKVVQAKSGWISLKLTLVRMSGTDSKRLELQQAWKCSWASGPA